MRGRGGKERDRTGKGKGRGGTEIGRTGKEKGQRGIEMAREDPAEETCQTD